MRFIPLLAGAAAVLLCGAAKAEPFYFGADLSYVNEMEDCGATYRVKGKPRDPYAVFKDAGTNLVRIRLWNDATWTRYSNLADVKKSIARAKANGMQVLLDFHYSDDWADGDKQPVVKAWAGITDADQLAQALYSYTLETLSELDREGLAPEMVQVGNETNPELLGGVKERPIDWSRNAKLLNAGIRAVRDFGLKAKVRPKVMLHIAQPENVEPWFEAAVEAGVTDFDQIGISYYRKWSTQSMEGLGRTINRLRFRYPAEIVVVETSYPWTNDAADQMPNLLGPDTLLEGYPATPQGQLRYMVDLTQTVKSNGGVGVVYWEPAWVSTRCKTRWGQGSSWENATFFDFHRGNELLPAATYTTHRYAEPVEVTFRIRTAADKPLYLWGDFMGARDHLVRLKPEAGAVQTFRARLAAGQKVRYQVFASAALGPGLVEGPQVDEGFVAAQVGQRATVFEHSAR
jgi:arabinogalactan endo-1,4-beta-galactosidase